MLNRYENINCGMFFLIGVYAALSIKKEATWDGEVIEKEIIEKEKSTDFAVYIEDQKHQKHENHENVLLIEKLISPKS